MKGDISVATLHVRNFPDDLHQAIMTLASQKQRSLGAEVTVLLKKALAYEELCNRRADALESITRRRRSFKLPKDAADSLALLREDRAR